MGTALDWRERLARAILARDFDAAAAELEMLKHTKPEWAASIYRARAAVNPPVPLPPRPPFALPIDGARPGAVLGDDLRERVRPSDPMFDGRDRAKAA